MKYILDTTKSDLMSDDDVNSEITGFLELSRDNDDSRFEDALRDATSGGNLTIFFERGSTHLGYGSESNPSDVYCKTHKEGNDIAIYISDEFLEQKGYYPDNDSQEDPVPFPVLVLVVHEVKHAADIANGNIPQNNDDWDSLTKEQKEAAKHVYEEETRAWVDDMLDDYPQLGISRQEDYDNTLVLEEHHHEPELKFDSDSTEKQVNAIEPEGSDSDAGDTDTYCDQVSEKCETAKETDTPLVLDLDGDGIELTSLNSVNAVYWDIDTARNDGMAEATGWITGGDGLLAIDTNSDGIINNSSELFGNQTGFANGFLALAAYDNNEDGLLTSGDAAWDDMIVWIDANTNGYSETGELHSLDNLLITEIDLGYSDVSYSISGNEILQESSFTINGNTNDIADVYFSYSNTNTVHDQDYTPDVNAYLLNVNLRGYGNLPHLHIAMSLDNTGTGNLLDLVSDFADLSFADIFTADDTIPDSVKDIMYRWAGVDSLNGDERGLHIDSRDLGFLEKMMGEDFLQNGVYSNPFHNAGAVLREAFHIAFQNIYARLVVQTAGGELFTGDFYYDIASDSIQGVTGLDSTVLSSLESEATALSTTGERTTLWQNVARMIEYTVGVGNLATADQNAFDTAITNSDATLDLSDITASLGFEGDTGQEIDGDANNNVLSGGSGHDVISGDDGNDTISGGVGHDMLYGENGNDTLDGEEGDDYILGGAGDDIYVVNAGEGYDFLEELSGTDEIQLGAGIELADLTFTRMGNRDLLIEIDQSAGGGKISVGDFFYTSGGVIETIRFYDTSTFDLDGQDWVLTGTDESEYLYGVTSGGLPDDTIYAGGGHDDVEAYAGDNTVYGQDGDDKIHAGDGADTLYGDDGDDRIRGGDGDDVIRGGTGDDTIYTGGGDDLVIYDSGDDVIAEFDNGDYGGTNDVIEMASGYIALDLSFSKVGNALIIDIDGGDTITVNDQYSSSSYAFETIRFSDLSTLDLSTIALTITGTESGETLNGASSINDTIYGLGGNDTVNAYSGDDKAYGGAGNDLVYGNQGNDRLYGEEGADTLYGGDGADKVQGGAGNDTMYSGAGDDLVVYESGDDYVQEYHGGSYGGTDIVEFAEGITSDDLSYARYSTAINDLVISISGFGSITLGDQYYGSSSSYAFETLRFADTSTIDISTIVAPIYGSASGESVNGDDNIDDIIYGLGGNDTLRGYTGNDELYGGDGNDTLYSYDGNDLLVGGAGDDWMQDKAGGDDIYVYESGLDTVYEKYGSDILRLTNSATINDISFSESGTHTTIILDSGVNEIEMRYFNYSGDNNTETIEFADGFTANLADYANWSWGTASGETINGTAGDDTLIGIAGNDTLDGGAGADGIHGGDGADTLTGGAGNDLLHGGEGSDTVDYGSDGAAVTVNLATGTATDGNSDTDTLYSIESVKGSAYNDTLTGSANADYLYGDAGTDAIYGGAGADYLFGEGGTDTLNGGDGADQLSGGADADTLYGDAGNDVLYGDAGNDLLYGKDGLDSLYGSTGDDTFVFETASAFNNVDVINDLDISSEDDKIDISDVLDGYYTHGTDVLTDFVQITDDGTDSTLSIDLNGGADNFLTVASILGVTGLTDEAALVTSGNLIVA